VMAVGLLQLREAANEGLAGDDALAKDYFDALWVDVVSGLCGHEDASTLSLKQFYAEVARQGGYLFRKNDPRPGWQCLWHGLKYIRQSVQAIQDFMKRKSCV
ncbi:hypothetical protein JYU15_00175, partial [bacterium AH-315-I18]|nr:hypothetical protein [bacterium AH-315-I18]